MAAGTFTTVPPTVNFGHNFTETDVSLGVIPRNALISLANLSWE